MEKLKKYKTIVRHLVEEVGTRGKKSSTPVNVQVILDDENGHYLLYSNDWKGQRRIYGCFLHIDVAPNGKVWLQHDGTDLIVGELLQEQGIPKKDIVLGFQSPVKRPDTGFALT